MRENFEGIQKNPEKIYGDWTKVGRALLASENNINVAMVDIKEYSTDMTEECFNQILVEYSNGRFELLPQGVNGYNIKDYLGIRYPRIVRWGAMPPNCKGVTRDLYDYGRK